jgi:hypothetical protein
LALGLAVSAAALWWAWPEVPMSELGRRLGAARWAWALPVLLSQAAHFWLKVVRWRRLLAPLRATSSRVLWSPTILGFFANNLLPAHLGELVRMHLGARRLRLPQLQVLSTLVVERVFDVLTIAALFLVALPLGRALPAGLREAGWWLLLACALALIGLWWFLRRGERLLRRLEFRPGTRSWRWPAVLVRHLQAGREGLRVLEHPRLLLGVIATSVAQWLVMAAGFVCAFQAFGTGLPPAAALVLLAVVTFAVLLPSAPGYVGTLQAAFVFTAGAFGIDDATAFSASLFFHVLSWGGVNLLGLVFLHRLHYGLRDLRRAAAAD